MKMFFIHLLNIVGFREPREVSTLIPITKQSEFKLGTIRHPFPRIISGIGQLGMWDQILA